MIQAVVDRLGRNSFAIKSIAAASSAALVAFTVNSDSPGSALAGFVVFPLWLLDAFFLERERGFRRLYDAVRQGLPSELRDGGYFTMEVPSALGRPGDLIKATASLSLSLYYPPLLLLIVTATLIVVL